LKFLENRNQFYYSLCPRQWLLQNFFIGRIWAAI